MTEKTLVSENMSEPFMLCVYYKKTNMNTLNVGQEYEVCYCS